MQEESRRPRSDSAPARRGASGARISANASGARCARTTASRRRLELLQPRPGAVARVPLGRRRPRWHLATTQRLCFALALWNGRDPILKERLFGLTNSEGNHGEDVKEYYFYLDSTPTHSYMKYLYKYPQAAYPYDDIDRDQPPRGRHDPEYELLDTGMFDDDRYFDVFVEYAKATPEDMLIGSPRTIAAREPRRCTCCRLCGIATLVLDGPQAAPALPILRDNDPRDRASSPYDPSSASIAATPRARRLLFTENETNDDARCSAANATALCQGRHQRLRRPRARDAVNPDSAEPRRAAHYRLAFRPAARRVRLRLRLCDWPWRPATRRGPFGLGSTPS